MNFVPRTEFVIRTRFAFLKYKLKLALTLFNAKKIILITEDNTNVMELNTANLRPGEILKNIELIYNNTVAEMDVDAKIKELINGE
jgi:hypothetical protein